MMDRKELAHAAYQIFLRDMKAIGENDLEVWKAIAETDDVSLMDFVEEKK